MHRGHKQGGYPLEDIDCLIQDELSRMIGRGHIELINDSVSNRCCDFADRHCCNSGSGWRYRSVPLSFEINLLKPIGVDGVFHRDILAERVDDVHLDKGIPGAEDGQAVL